MPNTLQTIVLFFLTVAAGAYVGVTLAFWQENRRSMQRRKDLDELLKRAERLNEDMCKVQSQ